jgi:hypothetical protein
MGVLKNNQENACIRYSVVVNYITRATVGGSFGWWDEIEAFVEAPS